MQATITHALYTNRGNIFAKFIDEKGNKRAGFFDTDLRFFIEAPIRHYDYARHNWPTRNHFATKAVDAVVEVSEPKDFNHGN